METWTDKNFFLPHSQAQTPYHEAAKQLGVFTCHTKCMTLFFIMFAAVETPIFGCRLPAVFALHRHCSHALIGIKGTVARKHD